MSKLIGIFPCVNGDFHGMLQFFTASSVTGFSVSCPVSKQSSLHLCNRSFQSFCEIKKNRQKECTITDYHPDTLPEMADI